MTRFLDVRIDSVGGELATSVAISQGTAIGNYQSLPLAQLLSDIQGRHVLIATHGYNVNREEGIASLSNWEGLLQLAEPSVFVGLLWPGDSVWAHGLDYPAEPRVANHAGILIAPFLDANFSGAASISLASHSLGARVVLQTTAQMKRRVRRAVVMAGAIDDDCLSKEFKPAADNISEISVLASKKDEVLSTLFPLGNLLGGIIAAGHPWWHGALGHSGPSNPRPANFEAPFQIPQTWDYGHHDYLRVDPPPPAGCAIGVPANVSPEGTGKPCGGADGWQQVWSAAFASTRFQQ